MARHPRPVRFAAGIALAVAGVAMPVLPGPRVLTLIGAAHLLADDIPGLRALLDRLPSLQRPPEVTSAS